MAFHTKVLLKTLQSCIADIDSVKESKKKKEHQYGHNMNIKLPEQSLLRGSVYFRH